MVAADKSGSGKTTLTTGLIRHYASHGRVVAPFKCGPDYIDTLHLERACGRKAYNLDTVMLTDETVRQVYAMGCGGADVAVTEGVMGIFDGVSAENFRGSSADVAAALGLPVVLVVDCSGSSFTAAAMIKGIQTLSKAKIVGVVLNNIASSRHELLVRSAVEAHTDAAVLGVLPKDQDRLIQSRHLGIKTALEADEEYYDMCASFVAEHTDTDKIISLGQADRPNYTITENISNGKTVWIAYDEAFQFYYNSNLAYLAQKSFDIRFFSPLKGETPQEGGLLYLGGGYPEVHAEKLAEISTTAKWIREYAVNGGYIYAECGGLMYLSRGIHTDGGFYPMASVIDAECRMCGRRQALGYVRAELKNDCIIGRKGAYNIGHEFHYSALEKYDGAFAYNITRVTDGKMSEDGIIFKNVFAAYTHLNFMCDKPLIDNIIAKMETE